MSQLDQAKKEAKRLFNLAKENQANQEIINHPAEKISTQQNYLNIENLSHAREILSVINGYKNWHEYEEVLKRKDFVFDKVDKVTINKENKEIYDNRKYYIQDIEFNKIIRANFNKHTLVIQQEHKPIILGRSKEKTLFETKEKKWELNQYPVLITGSTGAGKTETLLSMVSQYVENKEGVIYFDGKGDPSVYSKFFGYATKFNRLNDLYCLNFMTGSRDIFEKDERDNFKIDHETLSHSIDPINPMIGNSEYFQNFFGKMGEIIHSILRDIHRKEQLMDTQSLESILMLANLIKWAKDKSFLDNDITVQKINDYLVEIGLSLENINDEEDFNESLMKHSENCHKAYQTVKIFKTYSFLFKIDCTIDMEKIFLERKLLLILLPALEKSPDILCNLGALILFQIKHIEEKYQGYKKHLQNIILDEFNYFGQSLTTWDLNKTSNNYIFGCMDFYYKNDILIYILNNIKTNILMRSNSSDLPNKVKLDFIDNIDELPKLTRGYKGKSFIERFNRELNDLTEGQAYVMAKNYSPTTEQDIINNEYKFYCKFITCEYLPPKYEKKIHLVNHPKPIIYIKN